MKISYNKIKEFVIKHHIILLISIVTIGAIVVLSGLVIYNQSSYFCYSCHFNEGQYHYIDKELPAHENIDNNIFSCVKCHKDKTVQTIYFTNAQKINNTTQRMANLKQKSIVSSKAVYKTDQCLNCHPDKLNVMEIEPFLLKNKQLQKIGLTVNKSLHYRYELLNNEDRLLYEELSSKALVVDEEKNELLLLEKIKTGNCAQCHLQTKMINNESFTDKSVNFIARNPITCAGCHEDATTLDHPGTSLKIPTKETCQKCHHGKIHGKFRIFKADCDDKKETEHCIKCHPLYK